MVWHGAAGTSWVLTPAALYVWTLEKLTLGVDGRQAFLGLQQALLQVSDAVCQGLHLLHCTPLHLSSMSTCHDFA